MSLTVRRPFTSSLPIRQLESKRTTSGGATSRETLLRPPMAQSVSLSAGRFTCPSYWGCTQHHSTIVQRLVLTSAALSLQDLRWKSVLRLRCRLAASLLLEICGADIR